MKAAFLLLLALFCLTGVQTIDRNLQSSTGFVYTNSGSDWGGTCTSGSNQSPVDLETTSGTCDSTMVFDVSFSGAVTATFAKTATNFRGNATSGSFSTLFATDINGILTGYTATRVHFHAPAEHTIEGNTYDLEVQFNHTINADFKAKGATTKTTAMVSVLFSSSSSAAAHPFITAALATYVLGTAQTLNIQTYLGSLLPSPVPYYTYQGSYTTPACAEIVNWYVVSEPQYVTPAQLAVFTAFWAGNSTFAGGKGNNRPIQNTNSRTIKKGGVECEEQFVYFFSFFILYIFINYFIFKLL